MLLNALDGAVDQVLVLGYGLLLQPNVQLILNELHFDVRIAHDSFKVTEHALGLQQSWYSFTPA